jgi:hypothetical protein
LAEYSPIFECSLEFTFHQCCAEAPRRQFFIPIIRRMPDPVYDVYVTGATDTTPSGQMRIAATIAARYRVPAPAVAEALEGGHLRIAAGVAGPEAEELIRALAALGAIGRRSPAGVSLREGAAAENDASAVAGKDLHDALKPTDVRIVPQVVGMAEPMELAQSQRDGGTGARGPDTIRCPIHGLVYNRRQSSGCVRCLAPARELARKITQESGVPPARRGLSLRGDPVRRAFGGLALALVLGFLPAAYYARSIARPEKTVLRGRQVEIASSPATPASLVRFDELDNAVDAAHVRGAGRTLLIWIVVAGVTGVVWTKLT